MENIFSGENRSTFAVYKRLLKTSGRYLPFLIFGIIATFLVSGIDAGLTWLVKPIINQVFIARSSHFIAWLPAILFSAFFLRIASNFYSNYFISRAARGVVRDLRRMVFEHLLKLPASYFDQYSAGHILSAIVYNVDQVADASSDALISILREGGLLVGMVVVLFSLSWQLTLVLGVISPVLILLTRACSRRLRKLSHHIQHSVGDVTQVAEESIESYKIIRMHGMQSAEYEKFCAATETNRRREMKMVITNVLNNSIIQMLVALPAIAFIALVTSSYIAISAGSFTALVTALFGLLRPARQMGRINTKIQKGIAGAASVFATLDLPVENDGGHFILKEKAKGNIEYRHVNFVYPGTTAPVLFDISFSVSAGKTIAFVGRSGSGKTTLMNLLPRFYRVEAGTISLDGTPINDFQLANLREQMAFVTQHTTLFNATIAENIAYGKQHCTRGEIIAAAETAHALEFIQELPQGFDTVVGENGVMLSGGQRQRIAIARALIKNAPILLLDEATSALDTHAERHIQAALDSLTHNRTTLVIAHRLSTVEKADQILVLDQGRILERGTHAELLAKAGAYADLYKMQFAE